MKWIRIFIFSAFIIATSCTSQKKLVYFQGQLPQINNDSVFVLRIYPGDILSINIFTINSEAFPYLSAPNDKIASDRRSAYEKGTVVNDSGEVKLPLVGIVKLNGLSISEATTLIEKKYQEYIRDPIVSLKKLNFKVFVLGEVNRPGSYQIMNEKATLVEVLGMAGDVNQFGDRQKLRIIRDENNQRKDIYVNLTDASSLSATSFYIHPNDIIYVQPVKRRAFQNTTPAVTLFTSIITSAIVVLTFIVVTSQ